jgi:hypothetical protein
MLDEAGERQVADGRALSRLLVGQPSQGVAQEETVSFQCLGQVGAFSTGRNSVTHGVEVGVGVGVGVVVGGVVAGVVAGVVCGVVGVVVGGLVVGVGVGVREDGLGEADVGRALELVRDGVTDEPEELGAPVLPPPARDGATSEAAPNVPGAPAALDEGRSPPRRTGPGLGADAHPAQCVDPRFDVGLGAAPSVRGATCELGAGAAREGSTCPTGELPPRTP